MPDKPVLDSRSVVKSRDHDVNETTSDVLFVQILPRSLHFLLRSEEHKGEASLLSLAHFYDYIVVGHPEVPEKVLHILLRGLVGNTSQLDAPIHIFLVQIRPQVHRFLLKLIIEEALVLRVGHLIELNPARTNILALLFIHSVACFFLVLEEQSRLASFATIGEDAEVD